jgi:2-polyprenyl-6-methoxyphenol hydroxylase-like FAD-dependent oxidoreductase
VDFHNALKKAALERDGDLDPIALHTGCQITSVDPEQGSITLEDGQKMTGDILVGADGVHVCLRAMSITLSSSD